MAAASGCRSFGERCGAAVGRPLAATHAQIRERVSGKVRIPAPRRHTVGRGQVRGELGPLRRTTCPCGRRSPADHGGFPKCVAARHRVPTATPHAARVTFLIWLTHRQLIQKTSLPRPVARLPHWSIPDTPAQTSPLPDLLGVPAERLAHRRQRLVGVVVEVA
jgi:hypothetical protein